MLGQWLFTAQDHLPPKEGTRDVLKKAGKEQACCVISGTQNKIKMYNSLFCFFKKKKDLVIFNLMCTTVLSAYSICVHYAHA